MTGAAPGKRVAGLALALFTTLALSACGGGRVFVPRSDYGLAPEPRAYTEPGDCRGGSRLRAIALEPPEYSRRAFRSGQQGWVVVRVDISPQGRTRNVRVLDAQPSGPFEGSARKAARGWRFEPPGGEGLSRCVVVLDFRFGVGRVGL